MISEFSGTHRVPRYNLQQTVIDLAEGVKAGMMKPAMADHIQAIVAQRNGQSLNLPGCSICGAQVLENVKTLRLEIEHDWARHSGGQAQSMANVADAVEAARAASLRRAQREMDE